MENDSAKGGTYIRQKDSSLKLVQRTEEPAAKATAEEAKTPEPETPAVPPKPVKKDA